MLRGALRAVRTVPRVAARSVVPRALPRVLPAARFVSHEAEDDYSYSYQTRAVVREKAPQFTAQALVGDQFKKVSLADYKGKWVVLFFYPMDFTFVCPTEILAFSDRAKEFKERGVELLGCSIDSQFVHLAWTKTSRKEGGLGGKLNFPLIADVSRRIASDYGVLIENGADEGVAFRGLFIIDPNQVVRQITINDLPIGRSVDETLRLIDAFQFHEKHGEVCPADWKPGKSGMKADPVGSKSYFEKQ